MGNVDVEGAGLRVVPVQVDEAKHHVAHARGSVGRDVLGHGINAGLEAAVVLIKKIAVGILQGRTGLARAVDACINRIKLVERKGAVGRIQHGLERL